MIAPYRAHRSRLRGTRNGGPGRESGVLLRLSNASACPVVSTSNFLVYAFAAARKFVRVLLCIHLPRLRSFAR